MFELQGMLLEVVAGEYQGNQYLNCKIRSENVADGRILKYKANVKTVDEEKLRSYLDSQITVECDVVRGSDDTAMLRIMKIVE